MYIQIHCDVDPSRPQHTETSIGLSNPIATSSFLAKNPNTSSFFHDEKFLFHEIEKTQSLGHTRATPRYPFRDTFLTRATPRSLSRHHPCRDPFIRDTTSTPIYCSKEPRIFSPNRRHSLLQHGDSSPRLKRPHISTTASTTTSSFPFFSNFFSAFHDDRLHDDLFLTSPPPRPPRPFSLRFPHAAPTPSRGARSFPRF